MNDTLKEDTLVLGIETSCDDTCIAVVRNGKEVLSNIISSQAKLHEKYGGVVPEVAARSHLEILPYVLDEALKEAEVSMDDIDKIAVTKAPGLMPSVITGLNYARGLALSYDIPLNEINHLEAHIYSNHLYRETEDEKLEYPFLGLLVSGGHTEIWISKSPTEYTLLGKTRDDSSGEAFDKVARVMNLGYPGGPVIDKLAKEGDAASIELPRPMIDTDDLDFSFSGLKTAVKKKVEDYYEGKSPNHPKISEYKDFTKVELEALKKELDTNWTNDMCASFQEAVVDVLVYKILKAAESIGIDTIVVGGGVAANSRLQDKLSREAHDMGIDVRFPKMEFCLDNAAMVAGVGYWEYGQV